MRTLLVATTAVVLLLAAGTALAQLPESQIKVGAIVEVYYLSEWLPAEITEIQNGFERTRYRVRYLKDGSNDTAEARHMRPLGGGSAVAAKTAPQAPPSGKYQCFLAMYDYAGSYITVLRLQGGAYAYGKGSGTYKYTVGSKRLQFFGGPLAASASGELYDSNGRPGVQLQFKGNKANQNCRFIGQ